MNKPVSSIESCLELRAKSAEIICQELANNESQYEASITQRIGAALQGLPNVLPAGWYDPPPGGVAVIFGNAEDNFERTRFDTLRNKNYWPQAGISRSEETVSIIHASPVSNRGIMGDWGGTLYSGADEAIRQHVALCLDTVEQLAEFADVDMEFGDISRHADQLLEDRNLTNDRTILVHGRGASGTNCGHTIPWTDMSPTTDELNIIQGPDQSAINNLISSKRLFVSASETTAIPETGAFTVELRLESLVMPTLPSVYFHVIVAFEEGRKTISSNLNPFFDLFGMDYVRSGF